MAYLLVTNTRYTIFSNLGRGRLYGRFGPMTDVFMGFRCIRRAGVLVVLLLLGAEVAGAANAPPAPAGSEDLDAVNGFLWSADVRVRLEHAEQTGRRDALASTALLRLGITTPSVAGLSLTVEGERIEGLGGEAYDSTTNGRTRFAQVADPEATELNQAYVSYAGAWGRLRSRCGRGAWP